MTAPCILITGGAGFVGTNLAQRLLGEGARVRIYDSLARAGSEENIAWLEERFPRGLEFIHDDVRNAQSVRAAVKGVEHIYHLAAQVAVTTSLVDPLGDFEVNVRGALNVLEAARGATRPPSVLYSSTNKVYGVLADVPLHAREHRYEPTDAEMRARGVSELRPLDFHSPYGCSKGAADQYVLDYARSYGLAAVVFRMSCIYGPHQHGNEDQGWVAHFVRCALGGRQVAIYGDGLQVRDVLFVDDLVDAFERARAAMGALSGRAFNIGGGPANAIGVLELIRRIELRTGRPIPLRFDAWRVGDQRYYVSDASRFQEATGWRPRVAVDAGLDALCAWFAEEAPPRARGPESGSYAAAGAQT